jgi:hypothetical protein
MNFRQAHFGPSRAKEVAPMARPGDLVVFRISDVFVPGATELLEELSQNEQLMGSLVSLSDSGNDRDYYGVVALSTGQNVVVPLSRLQAISFLPAELNRK